MDVLEKEKSAPSINSYLPVFLNDPFSILFPPMFGYEDARGRLLDVFGFFFFVDANELLALVNIHAVFPFIIFVATSVRGLYMGL